MALWNAAARRRFQTVRSAFFRPKAGASSRTPNGPIIRLFTEVQDQPIFGANGVCQPPSSRRLECRAITISSSFGTTHAETLPDWLIEAAVDDAMPHGGQWHVG
jgi:hypothetical protein